MACRLTVNIADKEQQLCLDLRLCLSGLRLKKTIFIYMAITPHHQLKSFVQLTFEHSSSEIIQAQFEVVLSINYQVTRLDGNAKSSLDIDACDNFTQNALPKRRLFFLSYPV